MTELTRSAAALAGFQVPLIEAAGEQPGPRLTVIAGIHGCEYASIAAVRTWASSLASRPLAGRVTVLPIVNLPAFRARSPFVVPGDGKNLNRCFPGSSSGTVAEVIAAGLFQRFILGSDALVDVHAGDLAEKLVPFAIYDAGPSDSTARGMAEAYGLGYVVREAPGRERAVSGTTSFAAAAAGIPAIIAEAGGRGLIEADAVAAHLRGLDGVLRYLGMVPGAAASAAGDDATGRRGQPPAPPVHLASFLWPRTHVAGWWEPAVDAGEAVRAGQLLGTVQALDGGGTLETVTAPADAVVLFVTSSPAVEADGLLLGLGAA
jgi:predicted deacylase